MDLIVAPKYRTLLYGLTSVVLGYFSISAILKTSRSVKKKSRKLKKLSANAHKRQVNQPTASTGNSFFYPKYKPWVQLG
ncbi:hypothetical protein BB561_004777 [Smittium simulii]|uniref:Uncharacterized protein n=1 Tax=Smittium simulii TaxID=133385 RepID=A0A2T9YEB8_9FUNG|nr:hypothetical protein BB561_004777 [Smittium simulii]